MDDDVGADSVAIDLGFLTAPCIVESATALKMLT